MDHTLWAFFFFQADDGIRDLTVTGVQTCALPIWTSRIWSRSRNCRTRRRSIAPRRSSARCRRSRSSIPARSEERRVGKECRSRWWPDHLQEKMDAQLWAEVDGLLDDIPT